MSWESERGMVQRTQDLRPYAKILFLMRKTAITLLVLLGFLGGSPGQTPAAGSRANFSGRWEGVQKIQSEMPEVVADVVFTIRQTDGQLSGEIRFAGRARNRPKNKWVPADKFGGPILSPRVEGKVLTFDLTLRTSEGEEKTAHYRMDIIGPNRAILQPAEQLLIDMSADMRRKPAS
jgi:hypothetical protein